jgi:hypothetical protein
MKHILAVSITLLTSLTSIAQDLIITNTGDSIHCKVSQITKSYTYYTINQTISHIPSTEVVNIIFSTTKNAAKKKNTTVKKALNDIKITLKYGAGQRKASLHPSISDDFIDYYTDLNNGTFKGFNADIFLNKNFAIGFQYSIFSSYNKMTNILVFEEVNQEYLYGNLIDDITIEFYGPTITSRNAFLNNKLQLISSLSVGKTEYRNKAVVINKYNLSGFTIGFASEINLEYKIAKHIFLGGGVSFMTGMISDFFVETNYGNYNINLEKGNYEDVRRLGYTFNFTFSI